MIDDKEYNINVKVGDRTYPMTVKQRDEAHIRAAAEEVTKMYNQYSDKLPNVIDRMSIIALQMAVKSKDTELNEKLDKTTKELYDICDSIDKMLTKK